MRIQPCRRLIAPDVCLGLGLMAAVGCGQGRFTPPGADFDAMVLRVSRAGWIHKEKHHGRR